MRFKILKYITTFFITTACIISPLCIKAFSGEVDILVQKLMDKGILTPGEAQQIVTETKEEVRLDLAKGESPSVPKWVQNTKLKGDVRLRYQWQKQDTGTSQKATNRQRGRLRYRLGLETKINDKAKVGVGIASGTGDPRSTNVTFQNAFEHPSIRLDYAYAQYAPLASTTLVGGQIYNPIWRTDDLLWDSDINPQGIAMQFDWSSYPNVNLFTNAGFFVLDEASGYNADPVMWVVQPGINWKATDKVNLKGSFNYYGFNGLIGKLLDYRSSPATNTVATDPRGGYLYNYDSYGATAEIGFQEPLGTNGVFAQLPYVGVFGDYIHNPDPPSGDRDGWLIGGKIGYAKVGKSKEWQAKYMYRKLEKDAWLDVLPDSDFYGGATDVKGHEVVFEYGLMDNVIFAMDYYNAQRLSGDKRTENLFQADVTFKF